MPNIKSAIKRVRTSEVRRQANQSAKSSLRTAVKSLDKVVAAGSDKQEALRSASSVLDKAAAKGLIHPNNAARKKSRLAKHVAAAQ